ncbi:hypothetical protein BaRGS_00031620 [Batillaria attramentaria]|uniref:UNC93-like protein n=1 Tax=Batillaria attramentaria TaxID=370345 RepID=A0ABD0JR18_9CAEN
MTSNAHNSLSPWDYSGVGMGFGLYRPRRPSYTFATQQSRQRSESYRYAIRRETEGGGATVQEEDYIENVLSKVRKESYIQATKDQHNTDNHVELSSLTEHTSNHVGMVGEGGSANDALYETQNHINQKFAAQHCKADGRQLSFSHDKFEVTDVPVAGMGAMSASDVEPCRTASESPPAGVCGLKKNLIVLCISFVLIFSPFRGAQNLQSSLNAENQLGVVAMSCVHGTMVLTCLLAPLWTNVFTAKWTLTLGSLCFLLWFGANFYPTFYTLIPASVMAGFGHGLLWTAETSYLLKLAVDSAHTAREQLERKMFRFHALFLACFQTTHIWGNLISSLLLGERSKVVQQQMQAAEMAAVLDSYNMSESADKPLYESQCGVLYQCQAEVYIPVFPGKPFGFLVHTVILSGHDIVSVDAYIVNTAYFISERADLWPVLWKLMCAYLVMAFCGFCLILLLLDRIGAQADPDSSGIQMIKQHLCQLVGHRTFRLLIPLMVFSGLQQGFMYSDYNQFFVTCSLGVEFVGFCMITLGIANVAGAVIVTLVSHHKNSVLFVVLAAAWGVCDAVWQAQCNTLLCLTCTETPDIAFANTRMLQSVGSLLPSVWVQACV